jgi:hypothetical protein
MKISNAVYPSPNLRYDLAAREVVFERLNPETGEVVFQVPSRETLKHEEHAAAIAAVGKHVIARAPVATSAPSVAQPGATAIRATPPPAGSSGRPAISIVV